LNSPFACCLKVSPSLTGKKSVLASFQRDLASKKREASDALKAVQMELKEARKQIANLTNQLIGDNRMAQGHHNQMELNAQKQTMSLMTHTAKLGTST